MLNASARVRGDYPLWQTHHERAVIMDAVTSDYRDISIHLWKHGAGKASLADDTKRAYVLGPVADVLDKDDTTPWLIIHHKKNASFNIEADLRMMVDNPGRLSFCHWGDHHGRNDLKDIKNVMVIGAFGKPNTAHLARYLAATGKEPKELTCEEWRQIGPGEFKHDMLQAISRANLRNSDGGVAGECSVHVIAPAIADPETLLAETFPGCSITAWTPDPPKMGVRAQKVADCLTERFADPSVRAVKKKDVTDACGFGKAKQLSEVLRQPALQSFLIENGIMVELRRFIRKA